MRMAGKNTSLINILIVILILTYVLTRVAAAPCTIINSTIINSTNSSISADCTIFNSTIINSSIEDSTISYSEINSSVIIYSTITNSSFTSSNHTHSTILFSQLCTHSKGYYSSISNNIFYYGAFTYGNYTYFLPRNISKICEGTPPISGVLSANKTIVKSKDSIKLTYTGPIGASIIVSDKYSNRSSNPDGQAYSRAIVLDAATKMANYTVLVELNKSNFNYSHARSDGGDIRFYDYDGELKYYIETWNVSGKSIIWVKTKNEGSTFFRMAYGNSSLSSKSNASAAFLFYDDFESYSIGSTGSPIWNVSTGLWSVQNDSGNKVYRTTASYAWIDAYTYAVGISESNFSVSARIKPNMAGSYFLAMNVRGWQTLGYCTWLGNNGISWGQQAWLTNDFLGTSWHTLKGDSYGNITEIYLDNGWKANKTSTDVSVNFGLYYNYAPGYFDDIQIRKFARPDPKTSVGLETPYVVLQDFNNDGVYDGEANITDTQAQGIMLFKATINDNLGNTIHSYLNITLDNTAPFASINIGEGNTTLNRIITLQLNYSDEFGVDSCAYQNENADFSSAIFEPCTQTKQWQVSSALGVKTIFYAVKDEAGNMNVTNASLNYLLAVWDNTPPTINYVYDGLETTDSDYFNSNTTLSAHWDAIDYESGYIFYKYRIFENGTNITGFIDAGANTEIKITGLNLLPGANYSFEIIAMNPWNISSNITSDGAQLDQEAPNITSLTSSTHPDENTTYIDTTVSFEWNVTEDNLLIGYSYILDANPQSFSDSIIESNETNTTFNSISTGTHYFHLKAIDGAGNFFVSHKKINVFSNLTQILLAQPRTETANEIINISGTVNMESNITIYVNNINQINLTGNIGNANEQFTTQITLTNGTNQIYAIAQSGSTTTTSNTITVKKVLTQNANLSFKISYASIGSALQRMTYLNTATHLFGLASESNLASTTANPSLSLTTDTINPAFIFLAPADVDVRAKEKQLEDKTFLDSISPIFRLSGKQNLAGLLLAPGSYRLIGNSSAQQGRYYLYLENLGRENGQTKLKVEIR